MENLIFFLSAEFLLGVMALNLIGILWTAVLINLYNMPTIELKVSPKFVLLIEKITFCKYNPRKSPPECLEVEKETCTAPKKEIGENGEEQRENYRNTSSHEKRVAVMILDVLKSVVRKDDDEPVDYGKEWRFVARGIDKILFVLNILFLTCAVIFVILENYNF